MKEVQISWKKYLSLYALLKNDLGIEIGKFKKVYKCHATYMNHEKDFVYLMFDNEQDAIWFNLVHL
jgi:hypothetical protein